MRNEKDEQEKKVENKIWLQKLNSLSNEDFKKVIEAIEMLELMGHQWMPEQKDINAIKLIMDLYIKKGRIYTSICVFQYGKIQGKREERLRRRRKKKQNEK